MGGVGGYRHRVAVEAPGTPVPDPDGGYTEGWEPLDPPDWDCAITRATAADLERLSAGTVLSQATHVVKGNYHAGITTETRLTFDGRVFNVLSVVDRDERHEETDLVCGEVVE
jgi:SPP1 family predicted phage head-tail adaptor